MNSSDRYIVTYADALGSLELAVYARSLEEATEYASFCMSPGESATVEHAPLLGRVRS